MSHFELSATSLCLNLRAMESQVVELTEAEQAQHQLQMEQQLKSFWAKQFLEMEQLEVGSEQGASDCVDENEKRKERDRGDPIFT